ncbi:MAG: hypothetical protein ACKOPQ_00675 [Novosphingobium sp.]
MQSKTLLAALALAMLAPTAHAQQGQQLAPLPSLSLMQETGLRCSAAFALVAYDQKRKAPGASNYPDLGERGREYFVRTIARLMDETGATRDQVQVLLRQRVDSLQKGAIESKNPAEFVSRTITACLPLLDLEVPLRPAR